MNKIYGADDMILIGCTELISGKLRLFLWGIMPPLIMHLSLVSPTTPHMGKVRIIGEVDLI